MESHLNADIASASGRNVTFAVFSGGAKSLPSTLFSVLLGSTLPATVLVIFDRGRVCEDSFLWARVCDLATALGVPLKVIYSTRIGIRSNRDLLLASSPTPLVWMGDDDVIFLPSCLESYLSFFRKDFLFTGAFLAGTKVDVANLRGYSDWSLSPRSEYPETSPGDLNQIYLQGTPDKATGFLDTGNCLIRRDRCASLGIRFDLLRNSSPLGGEDTLFARQCLFKGAAGHTCLEARSWHLEKPLPRFTADSYRQGVIESEFARWLQIQSTP